MMKKQVRRVQSVLMILAMVVLAGCRPAVDPERQALALEAYSVLMDDFMTMIDGFLDLVYPDCYAGAYLDNDRLVIQLTDVSDETTAFYWRLLGRDAPIAFKQVDFSWNELTAIGETFVDTLERMDVSIVGFGVDTMRNTFHVSVERPDFIRTRRAARTDGLPITVEIGRLPEWPLRGG